MVDQVILDNVTINQPVADLTALAAIPTTNLISGCICYVVSVNSLYHWNGAAWIAFPPIATSGDVLTGANTVATVTPSTLSGLLGSRTLNGIPFSGGTTSAMSWTAAGTNGQVLIGRTSGGGPAFATLASSDSSISYTTGANSLGLKAVPVIAYSYALGDETTAETTGTKMTARAPYACTITNVRACLTEASSSGIPTFNILKNSSTIFSTKLTIDSGETTSTTAATPYVLSSSTFADDDQIDIAIDVAGTGAKGAKVTLYLRAT